MASRLLQLKNVRHHAGASFIADVDIDGDSMENPAASLVRLFENGLEIGPAHSPHADIENAGSGRFCHWYKQLYFSSSDATSPLKSDYTYTALVEESSRTAIQKPTFLALQSGVLRYPYKDVWCCKSPIDMALYQMLIWREKPRTILELGTLEGGSALWFADLFRAYNIDGHVYSLDIVSNSKVKDPLVTFHQGDVLDLKRSWPLEWIKRLPRPILAIEDSGHQFEMSAAVIAYMAEALRPGEYLVVEDGIATPMGEDAQFNGGPLRAIDEFLKSRSEFTIDREFCDFFGRNVTWSVDGFLRRT
ncbi:CmcI family methyltransferase [Bradyrhizobium sp. LHD-71]|uniref:CmcI family methyltransferase n=1 Tax=Bradyrhizobium sp. LHD-71 TaxID=3072141 RepID=UPI00280D14BA|nr:CmcI family methyltransferase [Bradyrhizobium sp. LHD-71]MDQ8730495.1 CmcI family methyltransferase [Bradyrhizobium sp. LHD-71]